MSTRRPFAVKPSSRLNPVAARHFEYSRALDEYESLIHALIEHAPLEIAIKDIKGRYIRVNPESHRLFHTTDKIKGTKSSGHLPEIYAEQFEAHDRSVLETQKSIQREHIIPGEQGDRVLRIVKFPIYDDVEQVQAIGSIGIDITDLRRTEEMLKHSLVEVERLKEQLHAENVYLKEEIQRDHSFEDIVGRSTALKQVLHQIEQVAASDATVLLQGETGTGKELIARAIHHLSHRKDRALIKIDCSTLPPALIESELFGHDRGAFTGAIQEKVGRFGLADRATVFLDEVGDLPIELQPKLLRVLQEGEFERVGSTKTHKVDVRIIAATNRNLLDAVRAGNFREDLFYRLSVFPVSVPPLRERVRDVPLLVEHFVKKYARRMGKRIDQIPKEMIETLEAHSWPGNVRELENLIERAVILTNGVTLNAADVDATCSGTSYQVHASLSLRTVERDHILRVLKESNGIVSQAARALGVPNGTLRSRMKKLGITRDTSFGQR